MKDMSTLQNDQYPGATTTQVYQYPGYRPISYSGDSPASTFVFNWSYELPLGPGKRFANKGNRALLSLIGGWNVAGYLRYSDGDSLSFTVPNTLSPLGYGVLFPNYAPGVPIFGATNPRDFNPAVSRYFAPAGAFVTPPSFQFGNLAPTLDSVRGWTQKAESISLGKSIPINDKFRAQFRVDINNPMNAVRWSDPNTSITSASYGQVTSAADGRKIQLYLAVQF